MRLHFLYGLFHNVISIVYLEHREGAGLTIRFDIDLGVNTVKGVLTLHDAELCVEWRRYNLFDAPVGPLESMTVPYTDLDSVTVRRRFYRPTIEVMAKSASTFGKMPLPAGDLAILKARVDRKDRGNAEAWGAEAYLRIADAMPGGDRIGIDDIRKD